MQKINSRKKIKISKKQKSNSKTLKIDKNISKQSYYLSGGVLTMDNVVQSMRKALPPKNGDILLADTGFVATFNGNQEKVPSKNDIKYFHDNGFAWGSTYDRKWIIITHENYEKITAIKKQQVEKERLELIEKRVEIQKKRLDIRKEKMEMSKLVVETEKEQLDLIEKRVEIRSKQLDNKKSRLDIDELDLRNKREVDRVISNKIFSILFPLMVSTIDADRTILGSEPFYTPLLSGKNKEIAMNKLMDLITKL